ncbi:MAG: cell division protein FtsZ [Clostridia bacterium]|nr:cell division protein FtsZ [Clostridia bacterium]
MFNDMTPDGYGNDNGIHEEEIESIGPAKIMVIGVGGAGNNAVNRMISSGITCTDYIAANTDSQVLAMAMCDKKIQLGRSLTKGLGAGADPEIGRQAAEESKAEITEAIKGTNLLFITCGMGGGTGTGAAPVIAKIARDLKILTVAVVTEPFGFEGRVRQENTKKGLDNLKKYVDTLIIIPNDKILSVVPKGTSMVDALQVADEILKQGIKGISELIVNPALINLDFADVRTILKDKGIAHLGVGVARGEDRIVDAVRVAVNSPLIETTIEGAHGVILNVVGGNDLTLDEVTKAANLVKDVIDASANVIFGARIDPNVQDEVEITVIATDFSGYNKNKTQQGPQAPIPPNRVPGTQPGGNAGGNTRIGGNYWGQNPQQSGATQNQRPQTAGYGQPGPLGGYYNPQQQYPTQQPYNPQQGQYVAPSQGQAPQGGQYSQQGQYSAPQQGGQYAAPQQQAPQGGGYFNPQTQQVPGQGAVQGTPNPGQDERSAGKDEPKFLSHLKNYRRDE